MKTLHPFWLILAIALLGMFSSTASAADEGDQPHIVALLGSGTATIVVDGQSRPATKGALVPLNAQIRTDGNVEAYVMVTTGIVASVKPNSTVSVETLSATDTQLHLERGRLVTEIDKNRPNPRLYKVRIGQGIAAARGTSFTVSDDTTGFSITTTADGVTFTPASGGQVTIRAGQVFYTPPGAPLATEPTPIATAASDPAIAAIIRDAVNTAATVVQNNLGNISADSATNIMAQVVSVAVSALPQEATTFTTTAIAAVTATGAATGSSGSAAAATVAAAAVQASPDQAAAIAGAAAAASPANAGVITAAAQQVAPTAKDGIAQQVAASTGQSTSTVQSNADAAANQATSAVNSAKDATSNVVAPTSTSQAPAGTQQTPPKTTDQQSTPTSPVDPALNVSPAT